VLINTVEIARQEGARAARRRRFEEARCPGDRTVDVVFAKDTAAEVDKLVEAFLKTRRTKPVAEDQRAAA